MKKKIIHYQLGLNDETKYNKCFTKSLRKNIRNYKNKD